MKLRKLRKSDVKKILVAVLGFGLIVGVIGLIANAIKSDDFTEVMTTYQVGGIGDDGKFVETKESIYSKKINLDNVDEIKIELDFNNDITYQLFFYDENDELLESTSASSNGFYEEVDTLGAVSMRVLITPKWERGDDKELNSISLLKYSKQLSILVKYTPTNLNELVIMSQVDANNYEEYALIEFEDGMTWEEWAESDYAESHNVGFKISDGVEVITINGLTLRLEDGSLALYSEKIYLNQRYVTSN